MIEDRGGGGCAEAREDRRAGVDGGFHVFGQGLVGHIAEVARSRAAGRQDGGGGKASKGEGDAGP